jgi:hypothetical protein
VSPSAVVVALDPQECVVLDVGEVVPGSGVDELLFVGREEGFGDGVVVAGGTAAHGAAHAVDGAEVGEFFGGVLAAAVAVEDDAFRGLSGDERGGEGLGDQAGPHVVGYSVSDYFSGMQVDHGGGVDPSLDGLDIRDVAAPASIGLLGSEVLADQIRRIDGSRTCGGGFLPGLGVASLQAGGLHQPPDSLGRESVAEHDQLGPDSADAGVTGEFFVDVVDDLGEFGVGALALARSGSTPSVVALAAHSELVAHERDRVLFLLGPARDRRVLHGCCFANQAATFFAKSRSILRVVFSLRSRSSSTRSVSDNSLSRPESPPLALLTHLPNVISWTPTVLATSRIVRPEWSTRLTAWS